LAIVAAKLGYAPVVALDNDERAVEATRINAKANGVQIAARAADLLSEDPPAATTIVANIPAPVPLQIASRLAELPRALIPAAQRVRADAERGGGGADPDQVLHAHAAARDSTSAPATARAPASASYRLSNAWMRWGGRRSRVCSITSAMPRNGNRPARKACT